jgi:hypothetical protein
MTQATSDIAPPGMMPRTIENWPRRRPNTAATVMTMAMPPTHTRAGLRS